MISCINLFFKKDKFYDQNKNICENHRKSLQKMNLLNSDLRVIYYLFIHFIKLPTIRSIIFIRE